MRVSKRLLTFLVLAFVTATSLAALSGDNTSVKGYGDTVFGMTLEQVLAAESSRSIMAITPATVYAKSFARAEIASVRISAFHFRVVYLFDETSDKLVQVNVTSLEQKNVGINGMAYTSLEKLLTEKYGPPTYSGKNKTSWKLTHITVDLQHVLIPGVMTQVVVAYRPVSASSNSAKDL